MNVIWVIDETIIKDSRYSNLAEVVRSQGMEAHVMKYIPFLHEYELPFDSKECSIFYGTVNMARCLRSKCFGMYAREESLLYHNYTSLLGLAPHYYLNHDAVATTFFDFRNNPQKYFELFQSDQLFLRPNSGLKTFTGFVIDSSAQNFQHEINSMQQISGTVDNTQIWVASPKVIIDEYRIIICDRKVVDGSRYRKDGEHYEDREVPVEAFELAKMVAECEWQPDTIYTCDVALLDNGMYKIIELNSFSCAGWYACDPELVVKAVSNQVWKEYQEQYES